MAWWVKNPPAMQKRPELWVWSLGWEDPLEEGMATHSSILAWRIPWTEEPGGLQSMGSQRVRHDWAYGIEVQFAIRRFSPGCLIGTSNPCQWLKWNWLPQHLPFSMNTIHDYAFIQTKNLGSILSSFLMVTSKHQFLSILSPNYLPNLCTPLQASMIPTFTSYHLPMDSGSI